MTATASDQRGNFFLTENRIIDDYNLGPFAGWVYVIIVRHINQRSGEAFPSIATLADKAGMCKRKVRDSIKILEEFGLLEVEHRVNEETGENYANHYRLPNHGAQVARVKYESEIMRDRVGTVGGVGTVGTHPLDPVGTQVGPVSTQGVGPVGTPNNTYIYNKTNSTKKIPAPAKAAGAAPDGDPPAPPLIAGIDLRQNVDAILAALESKPQEDWQAVLFSEQHTPIKGKPRKSLVAALAAALSPVRKLTSEETGQAFELAQVIADKAYGFNGRPIMGATKNRIMGTIKQVLIDLGDQAPALTVATLERAYQRYTADGTKAPRDAVKIVGMINEQLTKDGHNGKATNLRGISGGTGPGNGKTRAETGGYINTTTGEVSLPHVW